MRPAAVAISSWITLFVLLSTRLTPIPLSGSRSSSSSSIINSFSGRHLLSAPTPAPESPNPNPISACLIPRSHPCAFLQSHPECPTSAGGFIDYTHLFFCRFANLPALAYTLLALWLAALFYMLGNTAADYFCCSLRRLSALLRLPPTLAGVSLLPLGNGAPDVFASIAAFIGAGAGELGLNSVLGGAVFVTSIVAGLVYTISAGKSLRLDRSCFIRDTCFFLLTLLALALILWIGRITFWGSVCFISIYILYAASVAASEVIRKHASRIKWRPMQAVVDEEDDNWYSPLMDPELASDSSPSPIEITLPQWRWASNVAIYAHQQEDPAAVPRPLWGWSEQEESGSLRRYVRSIFRLMIDGPLTLPRQLTIPLVEDSRWCRPVAVCSAFLAPVLLAALVDERVNILISGAVIGVILAAAAALTTDSDHPPRRFLLPWVAGGFVMSIVWFYIIAKELVAVLVSLGVILEIDSALLGLTVLAWGNSMGDLMANVAMAYDGGSDGAQVAVSGCYAGPMFNTLAGLGISLLLASLKSYPDSFVIPSDPGLFYTIGFLVAGLVWALVVLPAGGMQPSRLLGVGLLVLYLLFLVFRIVQTSGYVSGR